MIRNQKLNHLKSLFVLIFANTYVQKCFHFSNELFSILHNELNKINILFLRDIFLSLLLIKKYSDSEPHRQCSTNVFINDI